MNVALAEHFTGNSASVVDGMNLIQRVKGDQDTFGNVATKVLSMALKEGSQSNRIDVVLDKYQENSMKNSERSVQGGETGYRLQCITGEQIVRKWRTFLSRIANKTTLITFIVRECKKVQNREKLHGKVLYIYVLKHAKKTIDILIKVGNNYISITDITSYHIFTFVRVSKCSVAASLTAEYSIE